MPQACVYFDQADMAFAKQSADSQGISLSKYIGSLVSDARAKKAWPASFWNTYGSCDDESFKRPEDPDIFSERPAYALD